MTHLEETLYCDGCGVEIGVGAQRVGSQVYCCPVCAQGLDCSCALRFDEEERRAGGRELAIPPGADLAG